MRDNIIYEDNHLLVVNKAAGTLTQGDKTSDDVVTDLYKPYLKDKYNKPGNVFLQPAHRLDRPVSGCLILTRTSKATTRITTAFRENKVQKSYVMISDQKADSNSGEVVHWLEKNTRNNKVHAFKREKDGAKRAQLSYEFIKAAGGKFLYLVKPVTGRSHQIRVQMSSVGAPILGDVKYGGTKHEHIRSIQLHCLSMSFDHPTKKEPLKVKCLPLMKGDWALFKHVLLSL